VASVPAAVIRPTFYTHSEVSGIPGRCQWIVPSFVSDGMGGGEGELVAAVQRDLARPVRALLELEDALTAELFKS